MSRFENRISRTDLYRIARAFADVFVASYEDPHEAILLDIDAPNTRRMDLNHRNMNNLPD